MIKICICVRNRLAITRKCIQALKKHSTLPHQIYVYDNLSHYLVKEHFEYFNKLYEEGQISQVTFNTKESTFDAFSKIVACNQFGHLHEMDPNKNKIDYLLFLDNDIIVLPGWDVLFKKAWEDVDKHNMNHIKVITMYKGGVVGGGVLDYEIAGVKTRYGFHGGSGFWCVRPNWFTDVGFLRPVPGRVKGHDMGYWELMRKSAGQDNYALALFAPMAFHIGGMLGSVCDTLHHGDGDRLEDIKFPNIERDIDGMSFDEFIETYKDQYRCVKW